MEMHTCHAVGCEARVPARRLMCAPCWRHVPVDLQKAVWAAYVPGQEIAGPSPAYLEAARAAIRAVEAITRPAPRSAAKVARDAIADRVEECVLLHPANGTVATPLFRVLDEKEKA